MKKISLIIGLLTISSTVFASMDDVFTANFGGEYVKCTADIKIAKSGEQLLVDYDSRPQDGHWSDTIKGYCLRHRFLTLDKVTENIYKKTAKVELWSNRFVDETLEVEILSEKMLRVNFTVIDSSYMRNGDYKYLATPKVQCN